MAVTRGAAGAGDRPDSTIYPASTAHLASFTRAMLLVGSILAQKEGTEVQRGQVIFHGKQCNRKLHPGDLSRFRAYALSTLPCTLENSRFSSLLRIPFTPLTQTILWGKSQSRGGERGRESLGELQNKPRTNPARLPHPGRPRESGEAKMVGCWILKVSKGWGAHMLWVVGLGAG